jgi:predicted GIY-YIG superfamily endonuclease
LHVERKLSRSTALRREAAIKALPRARKLTLVSTT